MRSTHDILAIIERSISEMKYPAQPPLIYDPIVYSMQEGGKRIRPLLMLMTTNLYRDDIEIGLDAAIAVEMFHCFTLLHDDIMDNSPLRRGRESVHKRWGSNVAILSGDTMMIYSYKLLINSGLDNLEKILKVFNRFGLEICEGQQFDMDFEAQEFVSRERYMDMIRLKTSVLIAGAIEIGAIIGGADDKDCELLYRYGLNIGLAFQLQDDILDTYGDISTLGKPIGGDITEGKKSYLTVKFFEVCSDSDRELLIGLLNNKSIDNESKIASVRQLYDRYDIKRLCDADVKMYFDLAIEQISMVDVEESKKRTIIDFSKKLITRNR